MTLTANAPLPAAAAVERLLLSDAAGPRMARFVAIGAASTLLNWVLFLSARSALPATWATLLALVASTLVNTAAQRRFTFDDRTSRTARRDHLMSLTVFTGSWLGSIAALGWLDAVTSSASAIAELAVVQSCTLIGSAARFGLLHSWNRSPATR